MNRHSGGHRFCPICGQIVETRVLANGYKQVRYGDGYAKQRKIVCAKDRYGNGGCGQVWITLEIPETLLGIDSSTEPQSKRGRRHG